MYLRAFHPERSEVWVVEQGAGVDVDGGLAPALGAHYPRGVDHTPEFRACVARNVTIYCSTHNLENIAAHNGILT